MLENLEDNSQSLLLKTIEENSILKTRLNKLQNKNKRLERDLKAARSKINRLKRKKESEGGTNHNPKKKQNKNVKGMMFFNRL